MLLLLRRNVCLAAGGDMVADVEGDVADVDFVGVNLPQLVSKSGQINREMSGVTRGARRVATGI